MVDVMHPGVWAEWGGSEAKGSGRSLGSAEKGFIKVISGH